MHEMPSMASHFRVSRMWQASWSQTSRNCEAEYDRPRRSLICDVAMIMAAADVKPTDTGPEMKSTNHPANHEKCLH
ncbi:unnamed protein product [Nesidiocoris tenuis]|uniref:Uncharacterized protein n=1 Tax=Nesidiocoris tenuis TaxID=355587 RepID=A0A6H5HJH7_9HEMI|nr:unnamed protein product [Nesidiocoris tenuis]